MDVVDPGVDVVDPERRARGWSIPADFEAKPRRRSSRLSARTRMNIGPVWLTELAVIRPQAGSTSTLWSLPLTTSRPTADAAPARRGRGFRGPGAARPGIRLGCAPGGRRARHPWQAGGSARSQRCGRRASGRPVGLGGGLRDGVRGARAGAGRVRLGLLGGADLRSLRGVCVRSGRGQHGGGGGPKRMRPRRSSLRRSVVSCTPDA